MTFFTYFLVLASSFAHARVNPIARNSEDTIDVFVPWNFNSGSEQVWYGDHLWYENYLGKRSYEYNASFEYDSQYRICSNSKLFTAVAILQLVEKGKIQSIYDDINLYLDENDLTAWGLSAGTTKYCPIVYGQQETICEQNYTMSFASLLSMQSGIIAAITCSYQPSQWQYQYCVQNEIEASYWGSIASTISYFINNPLWSIPRTTFDIPNHSDVYATENTNSYWYSNENFILLSYFVEKLANVSLQTYFQKNIFEIVELNNTFYDSYSQAFLIQSKLASEYFFYTNLPFPPSVYPDTPTGTYPPFALGNCASLEVNPGFQAGSGGIVSTLPDMVKWYSSLFLKQNTTVLTHESIRLLLYPWALQNNYPQYYGFGTETMFTTNYWSSPNLTTWTAENMTTVYYMGGSLCTFFTVMIWNGTVNPFGGPPIITTPLVVAVARNNRILNVSEPVWQRTQYSSEGTWEELTQNGDPYYQDEGWSDPACCGSTGAALSDTELIAFDLAWYFGSFPFEGQPTAKPVASPSIEYVTISSSSNDDDLGAAGIKAGIAAVVLLVIGLLLAFVLTAYLAYSIGRRHQEGTLQFPDLWKSRSEGAMANKENIEA